MKYDCLGTSDGIRCNKYDHCTKPCKPVELFADGNIKRKEPLMSEVSPLFTEANIYKDYKIALAGLQKETECRILKIREIESVRVRAIAAMLYADISVEQITEIVKSLPTSKSQIYRLINKP